MAAFESSAKDRVSLIEFYGYQGIDLHKVKRGLHVKPGKPATELTVEAVEDDVRRVLGAEAADVSMVCCDSPGGFVVYIGLPGTSVREFSYNDLPTEDLRLPDEILDLVDQVNEAVAVAVGRGGTDAQEDDDTGYALLHDATARSLQLKLRGLALKNQEELIHVLRASSREDHRIAAASALRYAARSPQQISALVQSCRDPSDAVRNNAARAVGVLLRSNRDLAKDVAADTFIEMVNSPVWTDRDKAGIVLVELTATRNAAVLNQLRAKALTALIEMAQWRDEKHAYSARVLLGRIAGLPEAQILDMANNKRAAEIIHAAQKP